MSFLSNKWFSIHIRQPNEELEYGAPDFTDLEKACTDADSVADLEIAKNSLPLHNYKKGRLGCTR